VVVEARRLHWLWVITMSATGRKPDILISGCDWTRNTGLYKHQLKRAISGVASKRGPRA
jgi:hypothetical protein